MKLYIKYTIFLHESSFYCTLPNLPLHLLLYYKCFYLGFLLYTFKCLVLSINWRIFSSDIPSTYPFSNLPGDRTFCVSSDRIAIAFCILGLIFLTAVVVAACALLRARRSGNAIPYYTRSLFSSSSSGGESGFGSKLLLQDSPCLGQSNSRGMQYGRIL